MPEQTSQMQVTSGGIAHKSAPAAPGQAQTANVPALAHTPSAPALGQTPSASVQLAQPPNVPRSKSPTAPVISRPSGLSDFARTPTANTPPGKSPGNSPFGKRTVSLAITHTRHPSTISRSGQASPGSPLGNIPTGSPKQPSPSRHRNFSLTRPENPRSPSMSRGPQPPSPGGSPAGRAAQQQPPSPWGPTSRGPSYSQPSPTGRGVPRIPSSPPQGSPKSMRADTMRRLSSVASPGVPLSVKRPVSRAGSQSPRSPSRLPSIPSSPSRLAVVVKLPPSAPSSAFPAPPSTSPTARTTSPSVRAPRPLTSIVLPESPTVVPPPISPASGVRLPEAPMSTEPVALQSLGPKVGPGAEVERNPIDWPPTREEDGGAGGKRGGGRHGARVGEGAMVSDGARDGLPVGEGRGVRRFGSYTGVH
eukprot:Hpha_TRINITY_DN15617_c0_g4::TRINITY_DN15617_c0_g4_i1::g.101605::m.101605